MFEEEIARERHVHVPQIERVEFGERAGQPKRVERIAETQDGLGAVDLVGLEATHVDVLIEFVELTLVVELGVELVDAFVRSSRNYRLIQIKTLKTNIKNQLFVLKLT